jgi:hypothetical protein
MKIALLITGQLRTYELCKHVVKHTLIDNYDTDVFLSIHKYNTNQTDMDYLNSTNDTNDDAIKNAIQYYNPINTYVWDESDENLIYSLTQINPNLPSDRRYKLILQQYYIVSKAYEMLKNHINTTGSQYDMVIRLRFDQFIFSNPSPLSKYVIYNSKNSRVIKYDINNINSIKKECENVKIELDNPKENEIYVFGASIQNSQRDYVNDQFWIHSYDLINVMSDFYNELPFLINTYSFFAIHYAFYEILFYRFLSSKKIVLKKSKVIGEFCREFFI